jgi:hypothetical protein
MDKRYYYTILGCVDEAAEVIAIDKENMKTCWNSLALLLAIGFFSVCTLTRLYCRERDSVHKKIFLLQIEPIFQITFE